MKIEMSHFACNEYIYCILVSPFKLGMNLNIFGMQNFKMDFFGFINAIFSLIWQSSN